MLSPGPGAAARASTTDADTVSLGLGGQLRFRTEAFQILSSERRQVEVSAAHVVPATARGRIDAVAVPRARQALRASAHPIQ